jgi:hypothetical protein
MNNPTTDKLVPQAIFNAFREQCIWLRNCYNIYRLLYEGGERTDAALRASAILFFRDLNVILIDYVLLQVCRITDPPQSKGRPNLTVAQIDSRLRAAGQMTDVIARRSDGLIRYRSIVNDARNKLVSHADLKSILSGPTVGAHTKEEVDRFFEDLQEYCDEVGRAMGAGPLDFRTQSGPGDVLDLIRVLRDSTQRPTGPAVPLS